MNDNINILFLIIDALRAENLSCYNYPKLTSPIIDSLAKEGVLFENAYSCIDNTDPSFTSIFSGKYPITHGIRHHAEISEKEMQDFRLTQTALLPQIMKDNKYSTAGIDWLGRWHKTGYDFYGTTIHSMTRSTPAQKHILQTFGKYKHILPHSIRFLLKKIWNQIHTQPSKHEARKLTNVALSLMKKQQKPFFLSIHYWDVHTPFDTIPPQYVKKFSTTQKSELVKDMLKRIDNSMWRDKVKKYHLKGITYINEITEKYNAAINFVDHEIGRLIRDLRTEGLYDSTLIVFTGDHGDNHMRNGIFAGHSGLYERVIKIPLILAGGRLPLGKRIQQVVQHVDIVPTLLDVLGIDVNPFHCDGESLLPVIRGKKGVHSEIFAMEACRKRYALSKDNFKYIYSPTERDLLHDFWKERGVLYQPVYDSRTELYDLEKDPEEHHNIVAEQPKRAQEMESRLLERIRTLETKKEKIILKNKIKNLRI